MSKEQGRKPREFWIDSDVSNFRLANIVDFECEGKIHVREVVPIDWEKVWKAYWEWHGSMKNESMYVDKIQQLVEKQLAGEE